jgi:rhodanese-related sulfurtransferase
VPSIGPGNVSGAQQGSIFYWLLYRLTGRGAWCAPADGRNPQQRVEADLAVRYPSVRHRTPEHLAERIEAGRAGMALFDVRAAGEFAISRIEGAVWLDPAIGADQFRKSHAKLIAGRDVIVYCAIGLRSARLAERLQSVMLQTGARSVTSLRGGIFRWHNEGRPLARADGDTRALHSFNARWARFLLAKS